MAGHMLQARAISAFVLTTVLNQVLLVGQGMAGNGAGIGQGAGVLDLPVTQVVAPHPPYAAFCRRQPVECDLSGPRFVAHSAELIATVAAVNAVVNAEVRFASDLEQYNAEEFWALPTSGRGDCEDEALEKRSRLAALGVPRAAMRLALVFHKELLVSHAVLTLETSAGTYVLDSLSDELQLWNQSPYNFEARERPDGKWERYDQRSWSYVR